MNTLLIMRHGEAENHRHPDFKRALVSRGQEQTRNVATNIGPQGVPDVMIASPAARALETAEIFAMALGRSVDGIVTDRDLYDHTEPEHLMRVIRRHADLAARVAVFGHNPGLSWLAGWLCGNNGVGLGNSDLVEVDLGGTDWNLAGAGDGRLVQHLRPGR